MAADQEAVTARSTVYAIKLYNNGNWIGSGSGVVIKPEYIITDAHVVNAPAQVKIVLKDNTEVQAQVVKIDVTQDLALLRVEGLKCPCAKIATKDPEVHERMLAIGYPYATMIGGIQIGNEGNFQGFIRPDQVPPETGTATTRKVLSSTNIAPGMSGGGMFLKQDDEFVVIALTQIVYFIPTGPTGPFSPRQYQTVHWLALGIPYEQIRVFLAANNITV